MRAPLRTPQDEAPRMKREALVVALMAELAAGEASRWAPYLVRAARRNTRLDATRRR
jgi:hypothetical protein